MRFVSFASGAQDRETRRQGGTRLITRRFTLDQNCQWNTPSSDMSYMNMSKIGPRFYFYMGVRRIVVEVQVCYSLSLAHCNLLVN